MGSSVAIRAGNANKKMAFSLFFAAPVATNARAVTFADVSRLAHFHVCMSHPRQQDCNLLFSRTLRTLVLRRRSPCTDALGARRIWVGVPDFSATAPLPGRCHVTQTIGTLLRHAPPHGSTGGQRAPQGPGPGPRVPLPDKRGIIERESVLILRRNPPRRVRHPAPSATRRPLAL